MERGHLYNFIYNTFVIRLAVVPQGGNTGLVGMLMLIG